MLSWNPGRRLVGVYGHGARSAARGLAATLAVLALAIAADARAIAITGFATMGASETQGTAYSGSWVPYLAIDRGINVGPSQSYNRAVGGSTTTSLLSGGQHTQVAALVQNGSVNLASIFIGGLDVPPVATQIIAGTLDVPTWSAGVVSRITTAIDTVMAQGADGMLVWGLPDMTLVPALASLGLPPAALASISAAVDAVNTQLLAATLARQIVFIDTAAAMRDVNAAALVIGGVTINTTVGNPDPTYFFQDGLHPAVIGNGVFANLALAGLNVGYGQGFAPFTDQVLLQKAGLGAIYTGETSSIDYSSYVHVVPEPTTVALLGAGLIGVGAARQRARRVA